MVSKQDEAIIANRAVLECLLRQTYTRRPGSTCGPSHMFRLSLVYIWDLGKESKISPEVCKQQLSFANTTEIFSGTIHTK